MKELIVGFLIALVISSYINGQPENSTPNEWDFAGGGKGAESAGVDLVDEVNEGVFQGEVLDSHEPVLLEFFEEGDKGCEDMKPVLGKLASESQGRMRLYRINAKTNPALVEKYEATAVPFFVLINQAKVLDSTNGVKTQKELSDWAKKALDLPVE